MVERALDWKPGCLNFATYWLCELGKVTKPLQASSYWYVKHGGLTVCDFGLTQVEIILPAHWLAQLCRWEWGLQVLRIQANGQSQKKSRKWISKAKVNSSAHTCFKDAREPLNGLPNGQSGFSISSFKLPPFIPGTVLSPQ